MTDNPQPKTPGQRIRKLRFEHEWLDAKGKSIKGMSQEQLAEEFGLHRYTVIGWEKDRWLPGWANLGQLADYFKVSVQYLLYGDDSHTQVPKSGESR